MALHGVAHVDAIDACLVLCSMDTYGTHCDQVMKTGAFSGAKSLAEFQCRQLGRVSKWGKPFLKNEGKYDLITMIAVDLGMHHFWT